MSEQVEYAQRTSSYDFREFGIRLTEVVISGFLMGLASAAGQRMLSGVRAPRPQLDVSDEKVTPLRKVV